MVPHATSGPQVHIDAAGRAHVTPNASENGVSYNGFQQFDVGKPGLSFQNEQANARTIVAEVFSAAPSRIQGDMDVVGPRANLILANQNGISVNGANFSNFGSVALTTGALSLRDQQQSEGQVQRYVDVSTNQGRIHIGDEGMAAT
ncbi:filamentous hemagglutinin N-terminal domain-containing protein [Comamonas sp. JC664]|uniref:two-partner secretion domain-containing protein n=1 Tax=Comamonas sp. JC664 TaxID=2801917 RepID=UPI00360A3D72